MRRIYYIGEEDELSCEALNIGFFASRTVEGQCENPATYRVEDRDSGESWDVCTDHKNLAKERGEAE
jgi:hypothetical protein